MARNKSLYFVVGFFVTVGTLAALAMILWLGASKYLVQFTVLKPLVGKLNGLIQPGRDTVGIRQDAVDARI